MMGLLVPHVGKRLDGFGVDPNGYWRPAYGYGVGTGYFSRAAGEVTVDRAMTLSAVFAATRIHTETFGTLPAGMIERIDKTRREIADHAVARLLRRPNPEQSSYIWRVQMEQFRLNGGNAFAEIERGIDDNPIALWPIHPSRIPPQNIRRNRTDRTGPEVGEPGELVYYVRNAKGRETPIRKRDMLHIPGVLPENGIYGRSIIAAGAASIGITLAQENSVEDFHRNGMSSRIVLDHPGRLSPEKARELRQQWQEVFSERGGGYKTIVTEGGMKVTVLSISPEDAQLLDSRKFGVLEVARWYRLPPHKLAELGRATWDNIESQNIEFVEDAVLPSVTCWEQEIDRQLLAEEERERYSVKFNLRGRMRADSGRRKDYYKSMFDIGTLSRNDIRALEDLDPVPGGDRYYIASNNYQPLGDDGMPVAQEEPEQTDGVTPDPGDDEPTERADPARAFDLGAVAERNRAHEAGLRSACREMVRAAWGDLIAFEARSVKRASEKRGAFPAWAAEFYGDGGKFLEAASNVVTRFSGAVAPFGGSFARLPFEHGFASLSRLEALYEVPGPEFPGALASELESWPRRADEFADAVMGET